MPGVTMGLTRSFVAQWIYASTRYDSI